jgi:hypothetical protein
MGTRADFYIGTGANAEWLGSIAWDGHEENFIGLADAKSETEFRANVAALAERDDFTTPSDGWPWPWSDSHTTDYAYAFADGRALVSCFGSEWIPIASPRADDFEYPEGKTADVPDMSARKNVTLGPRSGVLVFGIK